MPVRSARGSAPSQLSPTETGLLVAYDWIVFYSFYGGRFDNVKETDGEKKTRTIFSIFFVSKSEEVMSQQICDRVFYIDIIA